MKSRLLCALLSLSVASCATFGDGLAGRRAPDAPAPVVSEDAPGGATIARRSGFAKADDGTKIYYEVCGSGPAIVLVHGLGGNHAIWFQQVAPLARRFTVVTVSQRGFAPSGGDPSRYDVDRLVRDLAAVMDAAGIATAAIVGQSMGGWTALGAALRIPQRVSALVLADTTGGITTPRIAAHMRQVTAAAERLRDKPPPLGVHPALSPAFTSRRPDLAYLYQTMATFGSPSPDVISRQLAAARVTYQDLKGVRVPTLFIVGTDDRLFPPDLVRHAAAGVRKVEVSELGGAGHSAYYENPELFNAVLRSFLARRVKEYDVRTAR